MKEEKELEKDKEGEGEAEANKEGDANKEEKKTIVVNLDPAHIPSFVPEKLSDKINKANE